MWADFNPSSIPQSDTSAARIGFSDEIWLQDEAERRLVGSHFNPLKHLRGFDIELRTAPFPDFDC